MARRRARRRRTAKVGAKESAHAMPEKPGLRQRLTVYVVAAWNWMILLAAIAGMAIFARLTVALWQSADDLPAGEALLFQLMAVGAAAVVAFLAWQVWRGVRYLWHRRRST